MYLGIASSKWGSIIILLACIFISLALSDIPFFVGLQSTVPAETINLEGFAKKHQAKPVTGAPPPPSRPTVYTPPVKPTKLSEVTVTP